MFVFDVLFGQSDFDVGFDTFFVDVGAVGGEIFLDGYVAARAVVELVDFLNEPFAERFFAHDERSSVVFHCSGEDFACGRAASVDEDDEWFIAQILVSGSRGIFVAVAVNRADNDSAVEEHIRQINRIGEQTSGVRANVDDEALFVGVAFENLFEFGDCVLADERTQADVADFGVKFEVCGKFGRDVFYDDIGALNVVDFVGSVFASDEESYVCTFFAANAFGGFIDGNAFCGFSVYFEDFVFGLKTGFFARSVFDGGDDEQFSVFYAYLNADTFKRARNAACFFFKFFGVEEFRVGVVEACEHCFYGNVSVFVGFDFVVVAISPFRPFLVVVGAIDVFCVDKFPDSVIQNGSGRRERGRNHSKNECGNGKNQTIFENIFHDENPLIDNKHYNIKNDE